MHEMDTTHDDDYLLSLAGMAPVLMLLCGAFMNCCFSKDGLLVGQACQPSRKLCLQLRGINQETRCSDPDPPKTCRVSEAITCKSRGPASALTEARQHRLRTNSVCPPMFMELRK